MLAAFLLSIGFLGGNAAQAAGSVSFTSPADGSMAPVGTAITPTGQASATGTTGGGLDLVLVLDSSGSMSAIETAGGTTQSRREWQQDAAIAIVNALPAGSSRVSIVEFDSDANIVVGLTPLIPASNVTAIINAINGVDASGGTDIPDGINAARTELSNNGNPAASQQMVVFSDGSSSGDPGAAAALAAADGITVHSVALPGANLTTMQDISNNGGGIFANFTNPADLANIQNAFVGTGGTPVGIDKITITLPDGTVIDPNSINALGLFTVDSPFNIAAGPNTWTVTAFFDDGTTASDTVTVNGKVNGTPVVPLPAGLPLLLGGVGLLGFMRSRARKD
ncbi:MAG: vWA domain-containing protein [Pseudomonadota bacterium]